MRHVRATVILCAAFLLFATAASAQTTQTPPATQPHQHSSMQKSPAKPAAPGQMTMGCQQMMEMHQKMMQEMDGMDAKLDGLVQQMNNATGQAKVDATAAVVNEMVAQRKQMREGMAKMQGEMMEHMSEHMAAGGKGMMNCPMMQQMKKEMK